jgi:hypothetical protein
MGLRQPNVREGSTQQFTFDAGLNPGGGIVGMRSGCVPIDSAPRTLRAWRRARWWHIDSWTWGVRCDPTKPVMSAR